MLEFHGGKISKVSMDWTTGGHLNHPTLFLDTSGVFVSVGPMSKLSNKNSTFPNRNVNDGTFHQSVSESKFYWTLVFWKSCVCAAQDTCPGIFYSISRIPSFQDYLEHFFYKFKVLFRKIPIFGVFFYCTLECKRIFYPN